MKNKTKRKIKIAVAAASLFGIIGFAYDESEFEIAKNLDIYHTLFCELAIYYVDNIDSDKLVKKSIDEMLKTLDPYTVYIPESDIEDFRFMTTGQYGGIGAYIYSDTNGVVISEPIEESPALEAGIKAGDRILAIDGKNSVGFTSDKVSELLKGEPGSKVVLTIETPFTGKTRKVDVVRKKIKVRSVPYYGMIDNNIGYIRLTNFTENCSQEVKDALLALKKNDNLKGIVLDLRGNPGGLLNEAITISNLFVDKGSDIVSTKGKVEMWNNSYRATGNPVDNKIPLAVLVNSASASAAEIVSGVMQDLDRGVIVGSRTYGKGLVQTTRDLSYNTKLKLTTAKYYIPSGRCIQALDYSHRNADGSVGKVPDSLMTKFHTRAGREVYDGGGVLPDVVVEQETMADITFSLYQKKLIFNYATLFSQKHSSIGSADNFSIDDATYNDFKQFIAGKNYDYKLESERMISKLEEVIKNERSNCQTDAEIEALRAKLTHSKEADIETYKEEISLLLEEEIVSRYYYQEGRAKAQLRKDPVLQRALEVLNNNDEYRKLLSVN